MQSAGEILRQQRLKLKLTFTQVSDLTKIPVKTLRSIEKNRFVDLPGATYSQGFIKNYAAVLKLDPQLVLAVWRRDFNKLKPKSIMPTGLAKPLTTSAFSLTKPIVSIIFVVLMAAGYLSWSIIKLYQPPALTVIQPIEAATVVSPVTITGKTNHDASVTLNGKTVSLEEDGSFNTSFESLPGTATLTLQATSRRGKTTTLVRHVIIGK
jgi:cytoskeletal protein RodZ